MHTRAVIFDLYGVLGLNGWQDFKQLHFHGRWDDWEPLRQLGQQVDAGEASDEAFVAAIAAATGESEETVRYQFEHTQPNDELLAFIRSTLRGHYKIGLLSNASHDVLPGIFNTDDQALFDAVIMSLHVGLTKPDAAMYEKMCTKLGVRPEDCIMVDDQPRHLEAADKLGMKTVLYKSNTQAKRDITGLLNDD